MCNGILLRETAKFLAKIFFIDGKESNAVTVGLLKLWGYISSAITPKNKFLIHGIAYINQLKNLEILI